LAGFVLARLQKIPRVGDSFDFEGHRFTVEQMEGHRIAKVQIEKLQATAVGKAGD
jgi:putative hemolysin